MKKLYTMLLLVISLCTASCSDWLDVSPSNQVNGDKLFEIGDGSVSYTHLTLPTIA